MSFAQELREPAFAPRAFVKDKDARTLAREILAMTPATYAAAFKGSAIKRAKLWMLQRNACVALGSVGTRNDVAMLEAALLHENAIVREHAAWALRRLQT